MERGGRRGSLVNGLSFKGNPCSPGTSAVRLRIGDCICLLKGPEIPAPRSPSAPRDERGTGLSAITHAPSPARHPHHLRLFTLRATFTLSSARRDSGAHHVHSVTASRTWTVIPRSPLTHVQHSPGAPLISFNTLTGHRSRREGLSGTNQHVPGHDGQSPKSRMTRDRHVRMKASGGDPSRLLGGQSETAGRHHRRRHRRRHARPLRPHRHRRHHRPRPAAPPHHGTAT